MFVVLTDEKQYSNTPFSTLPSFRLCHHFFSFRFIHSIHPFHLIPIHPPPLFFPDRPMVFLPVPNFFTTFFFYKYLFPNTFHYRYPPNTTTQEQKHTQIFKIFVFLSSSYFSSSILFDPSQFLRNGESRTHRSPLFPIALHCFVRPRTSSIFAHTSIPHPHPPYFASTT